MDNVTPFPARPKKPLFDPRDPKSQTYLVYGLTLAAFVVSYPAGFLLSWVGVGCGVAALAIAASKRTEGVFWARSHFDFTLRTLVIGGVTWTLVSLVSALLFAFGAIVAAALKFIIMIWVIVRCVFGAVRASSTKAIANPITWLI